MVTADPYEFKSSTVDFDYDKDTGYILVTFNMISKPLAKVRVMNEDEADDLENKENLKIARFFLNEKDVESEHLPTKVMGN